MNNAKVFTTHYKPYLIGVMIYVIFIITMLQDVFFVFLITLLVIIGVVANSAKLFLNYFNITIDDNQVIAKTWLGKTFTLFEKQQIKSMTIRENEGLTICEVIADNKSHMFYPRVYRYQKLNAKESGDLLIQSLTNLINDPQKITLIQNPFNKPLDLNPNTRFLVYPALAIFAGMLYFDMTKIQGIHFDTMNFFLPNIGIVALTTILAVAIINRKRTKQNLITGLIVGIMAGLLFGSATKSYIHWHNENDPNLNVQYLPMVLDDFDKQQEQQRWLPLDKAKSLTQRDRLYISNSKMRQRINVNLQENKTYLVRIAVGQFNDVFIVKNGFEQVKPMEEKND